MKDIVERLNEQGVWAMVGDLGVDAANEIRQLRQRAAKAELELQGVKTAASRIIASSLESIAAEVQTATQQTVFDVFGWLTSRKEITSFGSSLDAAPAVQLITEFLEMRGMPQEKSEVGAKMDDGAFVTNVYDAYEAGRRSMQREYDEILVNYRRLTRELDVLLNGEAGAAPAASLADIIAQVKRQGIQIKSL